MDENILYPPWLGDSRFHDSHKSNLFRKDPEYYSVFGEEVPHDLPYFWPTKEPDYQDDYDEPSFKPRVDEIDVTIKPFDTIVIRRALDDCQDDAFVIAEFMLKDEETGEAGVQLL